MSVLGGRTEMRVLKHSICEKGKIQKKKKPSHQNQKKLSFKRPLLWSGALHHGVHSRPVPVIEGATWGKQVAIFLSLSKNRSGLNQPTVEMGRSKSLFIYLYLNFMSFQRMSIV
jgi:hypothetical protein